MFGFIAMADESPRNVGDMSGRVSRESGHGGGEALRVRDEIFALELE